MPCINLQWDLSAPNGEVPSIVNCQFSGNSRDMMYDPKVLNGKESRGRSRVDVHVWEWKVPSLLPYLDLGFDLRCPKHVSFFRGRSAFFLRWHIHIWATTVVLGTVSTEVKLVIVMITETSSWVSFKDSPLGKVLVTSYVSTLASFTSLARLCMARRLVNI